MLGTAAVQTKLSCALPPCVFRGTSLSFNAYISDGRVPFTYTTTCLSIQYKVDISLRMFNIDFEIDSATTLERRILADMYYSGFSQTPRLEKETTERMNLACFHLPAALASYQLRKRPDLFHTDERKHKQRSDLPNFCFRFCTFQQLKAPQTFSHQAPFERSASSMNVECIGAGAASSTFEASAPLDLAALRIRCSSTV